jgi:hypothetical protein
MACLLMFVLVRCDFQVTGGWPQRNCGAEPAHHARRLGCRDPRVLAPQDGPTVLVGHSFFGMILSEAGDDPKVSSLVYVAARAPDAGEDYAALAKRFPPPPASVGIVFDRDEGRVTETAFLHDFAGDLPPAQAHVL